MIASALFGALALCPDGNRITAFPVKFRVFDAAMRQKLITFKAG
jgi:hypothetical protein